MSINSPKLLRRCSEGAFRRLLIGSRLDTEGIGRGDGGQGNGVSGWKVVGCGFLAEKWAGIWREGVQGF